MFSIAGTPTDGTTSYRPQVCQVGENGVPSPYLCYKSTTANALNIIYSSADLPTTLSVSPSFLGLSVSDTSLNAALTGHNRTFTVTNLGPQTAPGMAVSVIGSLPAGTSIANNTCTGTLGISSTCTFDIHPGGTPTVAPGTASQPTLLQVAGTATNTIYPQAEVLTYGSLYENSFLFAMSDVSPYTASIGGTGLQLEDQVPTTQWANKYDAIGVYIGSTTPCNGSTDGACNTQQIIQFAATNPGTAFSASLCANKTIDGYLDFGHFCVAA